MYSIKDTDDNVLNQDDYNITFENCNILIQPDFRGNTYDITIKAEDTSFGIYNTAFSINIEEYPPLKFNEGFNSNIVINNLSNNTIIRNIFNDITVYATHCNLIFSNSYLSNCLDTDYGHYNSLKLFSNPVDSPTDPYDQVDSNIYNISFNPEYRNKTYTIGYNIYMSGYESQYIEVKFILTEINIPIIDKLESISATIPKTYNSNIPDIINLSDLYDYPYSNELKFNITSTSNYSYDGNNILTITPDFRNENYPLNIEAYDPYFTNQTSQNSSNNIINYDITEKPPLEFNGISPTTFIYNVSNDGSSSYIFEDLYDRNTSITEDNPYITIYIGDTITFIRTTDGHPIHIRNSSGTNIASPTDNTTTHIFDTIDTYEYYCSQDHQSMKGTIEVIEIPLQNQRYIEYNLGRTEKHFDLIDNVTIYATHCNIIINNITTLNTDDVREAHYNTTYPNAITIINDSNLTIATEHRGITYENTFDIYMSGYDTQKIIKTFNINELSIPNIVNNNNVYTSTIEETKTFILEDLYDYPYADELIFSIIDAKQKLKSVDTFENNIEQAIIHGLSNINNQCNLFIDLAIDEQEFEFTIKAEDTKFNLVNDSLTIEITKDTPLDFNVPNFTNQSMVYENITNMSNSIITIDFFDKYVSNIDEGNILVIEPMYDHNSIINGRLAYYPDYYPTHNERKPYNIIDSNVYFLPEHRGTEYSNIFKLYARNVECNIDYDSYYLQVNYICSEIQVPAIEFNNNKATIFPSLPLQFNTITEESYDLSTLYTYPYLNYLSFDYTIDQDIPYSNTVMEQSNLNIILKPKLRGMNYAITINVYDNNFQISNLELDLNINEIPAIKFKEESEYTDLYFNTKTITINDLTNTQIICNLESYIDNNSRTTILFSNIFPEVRNAHYDTTTNKNAVKRIDTTITDANIFNITTDTIEPYNNKDSYKVDADITKSINLIDGKEFSVAFNFYFTGVSTETEYFSIDGFDGDGDIQTILKCKIDTNTIKFETNSLNTIEHTIDTIGWKHVVFNFKNNKRQLYINNSFVLLDNNGLNNYLNNIQITINSDIEYFQSFRVIDKPLTTDDIDYLFNNQINTLFYEKNSLYINPEYRNETYTAQVVLTTTGYEEISRTLEFIITETQIQAITLKPEYNNILSYTYCNLLNHTCNIENISDFYNYPFSNHLIFTTSTNKTIDSYNTNKSYNISTDNDLRITNDLSITADYRDMDYIVTLTATDPVDKFNLVNSNFEVFIHEKPPIEFNNFELINTEYLTNLEKTELTCNIYDNIIINVDSKYLSNLTNVYTASTDDIRNAFYNKNDDDTYKSAYNVNNSNLEIIPEYRNQNYRLNFNINIEGYETQIITKIYDITECNIPSIVIDQTVNSNFTNLSNEEFINNDLADYFTTYPFKEYLKFIIIEPDDITDRKPFIVETFDVHSIQDRQFKVIPDFRDTTYNIKLLIYDPNFSYLYSLNYSSDFLKYEIPNFKPKNTVSIIEDLNNNKAINNYSSNNVNESLDLYFTEIAPIEFNNTINIIYYCNLTKDTETCNIYPNIKFNAPVEPIITTFNYITTEPDQAFYKPPDELNAISITDISNINVYPEYRNTSYSINIDIEHSNYPNQIITQTFFIHECNIPDIDFKYPNITFQHLQRQTTAINLLSNNDLKEYFNYPFLNELEYSYNVSNITQDIPQELVRYPDITITNSNITILPDYKGYMYAVEITATDTNFGISNSDFIITIDEKAPIELLNTPNIYSNFIVIDNLSNVNHIIGSASIYKRNHIDTANTLVRKEVNGASSTITDFKQRDPANPTVIDFGSSLTISPYYRDVNYNYVYDIYIDNRAATSHDYNYFKLKLVLNITELPIEPINVYNDTKVIYPDLSNNVILITDLQSLYDYPFKEYLQFNYSNSHTGDYDITLTESNLTVIAGLRDQTYTLTLQAYDPLFTYHPDQNYVDCNLTGNDSNSNLINEVLQFEFQELPAIRFSDGSIGTKTIDITTSGNIQCNIDITTLVEVFTDHSVFMLSNTSTLQRTAHYIEGDHSNAVFFGYPIDGTVSKTTDTTIYINPEYRGITYTANIDIYMSNYPSNTITLSLNITEDLIPIIESATTFDTSRPISITEVIIPDLKSQYNYVYSNQLQFTCNIIELNETTLGYSVVLDDDTLTVDPDLRGNSYQVKIIAYDPNFTSNTELGLDKPYCNLINDRLIFTFEETPSIYFKDMEYTELSKTISINAPNNTQILCNLTDILSNQTAEGVYIIESLSGVNTDNKAHYLYGNDSNAVYIGNFVDGFLTIDTDPIININPEYRGDTEYTVSFDIYASNFTERKLTINLSITEDVIPNIDLLTDFETEFSNLSNNIVIIDNLQDKYNYVYSNELVFTIVNGPIPGVILNDKTLTITPTLRNSAYDIEIKAEESNIKQNGNDLYNSELVFNIHEIPSIRVKDSYISSSYYEFDISLPQYLDSSYYIFKQADLTEHMFVKGLDECNIILEIKDSSSFKNYSLNATSNELNIVFDYDYYEACNIDLEAYLENYEGIKLETTIRVIIPPLGAPILTNDKQYYNLIGDNYIDIATHKIEFPNVFKNTQDVENLTINIINIESESSFNYDGNMIYSYIKPTANFYRQYNTTTDAITLIDSIDFLSFNNNCNEIGPYYQVDNDKYNVIYAFKHSNTGYTIKFEEKYNNCNLEVLVVGGGGGGGLGTDTMVGNGGSGGEVIYSNITIDSSKTYNIVVGDGGDGGDGGDSASAGENSSFDNITTNGGARATTETITSDVFYVNNVRTFTPTIDFKVEGVGYSNVEEKLFMNLNCNFDSPVLSIGAGSNTEDPSIGKYEENSSNFYTIYNNITIGDYDSSKIYLGGGGKYGYGVKTLSRSVYSCGRGGSGRLGHGDTNNCNIPTEIDALVYSNIVAISTGNYHSLFLDENGNVYSCGMYANGRIGHGNITDNKYYPTIIDTYSNLDSIIDRPNIVAISSYSDHSLALDENGYVYSYGIGFSGQLGHGNTNHKFYPTRIDTYYFNLDSPINRPNIVAISVGASHSLFLDQDGYVYSCGYKNDRLGHGNTWDNYYYPTRIDNLSNIVAISAGSEHSLFLDNLGNVYSCGSSGGRLGRGGNNTIPVQIDTTNIGDSKIVAISAGKDHSLFLDENGNVYSCGNSGYSQLGHGNTDNYSIPTQIDALADSNIVAISASDNESVFLDENGYVYSCGRNYYGELGNGKSQTTDPNNYEVLTVTKINTISNIVALINSTDHSLFIKANVETELPSPASLGGGGNAIQDSSSSGKTLSGGGGSGGAINHPGGKGGSGIVLLKYSTGYNYYYQDEYYCNLPPLYQELTVRAENIFGQSNATLRFINQNEINTLAIADITVPTYKIDITTNITCNISSDFEIVYVDENVITNVSKNNEDLKITNSNRGLYYDVIINDSNYNYVYRIEESGDSAKPILVNNNNYFNLVSNSIIEYPNIFKNIP